MQLLQLNKQDAFKEGEVAKANAQRDVLLAQKRTRRS